MDKFTERLIIEKLSGKRLCQEELDNIASQISCHLDSDYENVHNMSDLMNAVDMYIKKHLHNKADIHSALHSVKAWYNFYRKGFGFGQL